MSEHPLNHQTPSHLRRDLHDVRALHDGRGHHLPPGDGDGRFSRC